MIAGIWARLRLSCPQINWKRPREFSFHTTSLRSTSGIFGISMSSENWSPSRVHVDNKSIRGDFIDRLHNPSHLPKGSGPQSIALPYPPGKSIDRYIYPCSAHRIHQSPQYSRPFCVSPLSPLPVPALPATSWRQLGPAKSQQRDPSLWRKAPPSEPRDAPFGAGPWRLPTRDSVPPRPRRLGDYSGECLYHSSLCLNTSH